MPGPPPPPPAAPPVCPPPPVFTPSKSSGDQRGALLQSIRQGAKLKKAVTNDRSAPSISGSKSNNNNSSAPTPSLSNTSTPVSNGLGLGGLFAGGMPKLRPTAKQFDNVQNDVSKTNNSNSVNTRKSPNRLELASNSPRNFNNVHSEVQSALKKQMATDSNRNRGPPPPAPVRNISQSTDNIQNSGRPSCHVRNGSSNGVHVNTSSLHKSAKSPSPQPTPTSPHPPSFNSLLTNSSTLHRKANSSANLTVFDSAEVTLSNNSLPARPSNRKPNLAPKPPIVLNGKPAAPLKKSVTNGRPISINRAQSMRTPRSPSPQSPDEVNYHAKFGTVRNLSSLLDKSIGPNMIPRVRPTLNGRPTAPPPLIPPQQVPPPPPSKSITVKPPNHAPPPPPTVIPQAPNHAPPPPPHRTTVQLQVPLRAPPAVPVSSNLSAPPPPPRHSSMRDAATGRRALFLDLDQKFKNDFHTVDQFPRPTLYRNIPKYYSSKTVCNKQQAPLPPNQVQTNNRFWDASC